MIQSADVRKCVGGFVFMRCCGVLAGKKLAGNKKPAS